MRMAVSICAVIATLRFSSCVGSISISACCTYARCMILTATSGLGVSTSANGVPAVHRECVTYHKTCGGTAKPKNGACNLLRAAEPTDGYVLQHLVKGVCLCGHHLVQHRSVDDAWAYGIDANASCGVVECCAFGEPKHAMLRGLVCSPFGTGHQSSDRRAVDDGAAPLREHLPQLALHATPHAAKIDGNHAVKVFSRSIGGFRRDVLDARVIVGRIEPPERSHGLLNQTFYLSVVGDVAADGESLVPQRGQFLGGRTYSLFICIGEHDRSARFGESPRRREAQTGSGACDKSNLAFEGHVHSGTLIFRERWLVRALFKHILDDGSRGERIGPTGIEGEMSEQLSYFFPRQPVIHRPVQVIRYLRDLAGRDESAHGDEAPVPRSQARSQPEIPEEHVGRVLDEAWRDLAELLSDTRGPLLLRSLVERKLRSRRRWELIGPDIAALEDVPCSRDCIHGVRPASIKRQVRNDLGDLGRFDTVVEREIEIV